MTTPSPTDITAGLQARHAATEGEPLDDEKLHQAIVNMAAWTVEQGQRDGEPEDRIVAAVKALALAAAAIDGFNTVGCDNCDGRYDTEVVEAADDVVPPSQTARDANGDPDVTICGFCIHEARNTDPEMPEPMTDAEWRELQRLNEEDEASYG